MINLIQKPCVIKSIFYTDQIEFDSPYPCPTYLCPWSQKKIWRLQLERDSTTSISSHSLCNFRVNFRVPQGWKEICRVKYVAESGRLSTEPKGTTEGESEGRLWREATSAPRPMGAWLSRIRPTFAFPPFSLSLSSPLAGYLFHIWFNFFIIQFLHLYKAQTVSFLDGDNSPHSHE